MESTGVRKGSLDVGRWTLTRDFFRLPGTENRALRIRRDLRLGCPRAEEDVHHVADVLLVGHGVGVFGGERDECFEMRGEICEEADAGGGVEFVAAHEGLEREARFVGGTRAGGGVRRDAGACGAS